MAIVYVGDGHVEARLKRRPAFDEDGHKALAAVVDAVCEVHAEEPVTAVVFLGDLNHKDSVFGEDVWRIRRQVERIQALGARVLGIEGNHDRAPYGQPAFTLAGIEDIGKGPVVSVGDVRIRGIAHTPDLESMLPAPGQQDVLVLHTGFRENLGWGENPMPVSRVQGLARLVVCGHIHKRGWLAPGVWSSGSTHPVNVTESDDRAVLAVYSDFSYREVPIKVRRVVQIEVGVDWQGAVGAACAEPGDGRLALAVKCPGEVAGEIRVPDTVDLIVMPVADPDHGPELPEGDSPIVTAEEVARMEVEPGPVQTALLRILKDPSDAEAAATWLRDEVARNMQEVK